MYSSANEDETKYSPSDPEYNEQKREEKKRKAEEKKAKRAKIKHIKIRATQGLSGEESPSPLDDGNKRDDEREIGLQGGPAGSRGTLLDLATGAKSGTGSAMSPGLPIAMSEPMKDAWSSLLKQDEEPHSFNLNEVFESPNHEWYDQIMGMETPMIQNLVNSGLMDAMGYKNHHHGDAETLSGMHEENLHPQASMDMIMEHRNSLLVLDAMMQGKGHTVPQQFRDQHQNADMTRMLSDMPPHAQVAANLASLYTNLNYLGQLIGPQMGEPDDDFRTKNASEPMEDAWSSLLKQDPHVHDVGDGSDEDTQRYFDEEVRPEVMNPNTPRPHAMVPHKRLEEKINRMLEGILEYDEDILNEYNYRMVENDLNAQGSAVSDAGFDPIFQDIHRSEPMEDAWSDLLKRETPRTIAGRRRREARQQFRPSTGQFKAPPGGMSGGAGATMRRFKAQMRGIKSGKKTGLMKPHLSVEMSHRGIQTKQPLSKDPQKYTQYKGQSEARKILGNVRTPFSPHARYGARSNYAGPTGAGRIGGLMPGQRGQMARPALRRMRVRRPRMPRMSAPRPPTPPMMPQMQSSVPAMPASPSTIMMSEERYYSELLKARNSLHRIELLNLMRRLIQAKEREAKLKKSEGIKPNSGHLPAHPAGVEPSDDEDPDGPTENLETDAKTFGLDPVGIINSRRGHM
jgi:hypothetical protein